MSKTAKYVARAICYGQIIKLWYGRKAQTLLPSGARLRLVRSVGQPERSKSCGAGLSLHVDLRSQIGHNPYSLQIVIAYSGDLVELTGIAGGT